jgi:uncharacterized protein YjbI with pentapeptide repeats
MNRDKLDRILEEHKLWWDTRGREGRLADLDEADLRGAYLRGVNLRGASLDDANLNYANLNGANLSGAHLRSADLEGSDLRGADLRGTDMADTDMTGTSLAGVSTNWFTRMTARGARNVTDEQRAQLGMQPPPRARNARRATDLARRLSR